MLQFRTPAYFIFSAIAGLFATLLLFFSLQSAHNMSFGMTQNSQPLQRLVSGEILPGHPLYVFDRAKDRVRDVFTFTASKKAALYRSYADHRLKIAQRLIELGEVNVGIQTATKAEIYLGRAVQQMQEKDNKMLFSEKEYEGLYSQLQNHYETLVFLKSEMTDQQKSVIDSSLDYNQSLQESIRGYIKDSFLTE